MAETKLAEANDLDSLSFIESVCFSVPWSKSSIEESLNNKSFRFFKLDDDGKTVGYGGIMTVLDESDVVNIAVLPEYRGRGYGKMLLSRLLSEAKNMGAALVHLEVRQSNIPAISLYESFGFEADGVRKNYYTKPPENAVLMTKKL